MSGIDIDVISELCDNCSVDTYCTLKEILKISHIIEPRFLIQLKCIEIYKYEAGTRFNTDIGWEEATKEWIELGYASLFATIYNELLTKNRLPNPKRIYNLIKQRTQQLETH